MAPGRIWMQWQTKCIERFTVTIITTEPNEQMAWGHNEPKASEDSRRPFILPQELEMTRLVEGLDPGDHAAFSISGVGK